VSTTTSVRSGQAPGAEFATLADVYARGAYAGFVRTYRLVGPVPLALVRFRQPAGEFPDPPTDDYTLAINEQGRGQMSFDLGAGRHAQPFRVGDLVLKPPGVATRVAMDAPHQKSFISLPQAFVAQLTEAEGRSADFGALHAASFRSAAISRLLEQLWAETAEGSPYGRLFTEGAAMSLIAMLLRLSGPSTPATSEARPLSASRLRCVRAWIEAHLAEGFGLADMARSVSLSPYHFSRAFKAATGETPRAHVTARRIERAKELLMDPDLPLAQIAQMCGFADQSHFTALFGRHTGMTPGVWRRSFV
jgi:AraC family transcriptional regulator